MVHPGGLAVSNPESNQIHGGLGRAHGSARLMAGRNSARLQRPPFSVTGGGWHGKSSQPQQINIHHDHTDSSRLQIEEDGRKTQNDMRMNSTWKENGMWAVEIAGGYLLLLREKGRSRSRILFSKRDRRVNDSIAYS